MPEAIRSKVAAATVRFRRLSITTEPSGSVACPARPARFITPCPPCSRYRTRLLSVLCTQCSDHVCASVSSSMSRGSRPSRRYSAWIAFISSRLRKRCASRDSFVNCSSVRSRSGTCPTFSSYSCPLGKLAGVHDPLVIWCTTPLASSRLAKACASSTPTPVRSYRTPVETPTSTPSRVRRPSRTDCAAGSITPGSGCTSMTAAPAAGPCPTVATSTTGSANRPVAALPRASVPREPSSR